MTELKNKFVSLELVLELLVGAMEEDDGISNITDVLEDIRELPFICSDNKRPESVLEKIKKICEEIQSYGVVFEKHFCDNCKLYALDDKGYRECLLGNVPKLLNLDKINKILDSSREG